MHGEDLLVDDCCDRQAVEAVRKCLPELDVVSAFAFIVEAVDSVDGGTLVVSAKDEEVFGVLDLVREEQADGFQGLLASIHVITEEEVVRFGREAAILEQAEEIVVLTMNVATDLSKKHVNSTIPGVFVTVQKGDRTLIGASSSRRMGCEMKISLALVHR